MMNSLRRIADYDSLPMFRGVIVALVQLKGYLMNSIATFFLILIVGFHFNNRVWAQETVRGFRLPAEIWGFQRGELIDNEVHSKGLGVTIPYGMPGIKATVFIYDGQIRDLPEGIGSLIVRSQAVQAMRDIFSSYVDVRVLEDLAPGEKQCRNFLRAKLSYIDPRSSAKVVLHSYVYLGSKGGNFVKMRLSYSSAIAAWGALSAERDFAQALCKITNG